MYEILDSISGEVVDRTASLASARRTIDYRNTRTLRPHHLRMRRDEAAESVEPFDWTRHVNRRDLPNR